jgi:hypothetical protein
VHWGRGAKATAALSDLANVTIDELDLGALATIDAFVAARGCSPEQAPSLKARARQVSRIGDGIAQRDERRWALD